MAGRRRGLLMPRGVARRRRTVQRAGGGQHAAQRLQGREGDARCIGAIHRGAHHGIEHPLREHDAAAVRVVDRDTAEEVPAMIGAHDDVPPAQRMPGVEHGADIGPPRIML